MKIPDITVDYRTRRLVALVTAMTLTSDVSAATGKGIRDTVRAIRMVAEAGVRERVVTLTNRLAAAVTEAEPFEEWHVCVKQACDDLVNAVERRL